MAVCIKDQIQNMNLVIGCTIGCSYCYARNNVRRFHMTEDFSRPEYFPGKLKLMDRKRPQNLLLTGMSDFSDWDSEWREEVFARIARNPQHQYIFPESHGILSISISFSPNGRRRFSFPQSLIMSGSE